MSLLLLDLNLHLVVVQQLLGKASLSLSLPIHYHIPRHHGLALIVEVLSMSPAGPKMFHRASEVDQIFESDRGCSRLSSEQELLDSWNPSPANPSS